MVELLVTIGLLLLGYYAGSSAERRHYKRIQTRERASMGLMALPLKHPPQLDEATDPVLVSGSVVISVDYFKAFVAGLRNLFGGRVRTYESLLDRARREAVLRMKDNARQCGCDLIVCVRLETAPIAGAPGSSMGVEVVAYGTGVRQSLSQPA